ncbi:MAG: radical SAM protein [Proteobacteria bacterium]|nr:radical SAM protein [Pseudomonadota bacterium]MCP4919014.1 radical SAM protein [Pseudomonadota bacterium]
MQRLDLKVGFSCNSRCVFCVQGDKRSRVEPRTTAQLLATLEEKRSLCHEVVFTGGEVTLRNDLPSLVRAAVELGYERIQVQTNGRLLSRMELVDGLLDAGVTEFSPALHGANSATHDGLTNARGSFRQTVRGIANLRRRGALVCLNSVIVKQNAGQLAEMARLFVQLDVSQFQFAFVHALGSAGTHFESVVPRYRDIQQQLHQALAIGQAAGVRCMTEAVPLCWMKEWEEFVAERIMPDLALVEPDREVPSYTDYRLRLGKAHGPPCEDCTWSHRCEGPWREYPERFGWEEFVGRRDACP